MTSYDNINMNSSRPYDFMKNEKNNSFLKDLLQEKEEKLKDLIEKNERMEKDYLRMQIQLKTMEEKLKSKTEKEYVTNTNTSSNFLLPSEFKKLWEDFAHKDLSDCFIDFYDQPIVTFHMTHEIFIISLELFREQFKSLIVQVLGVLNVPNEKNFYKQLEGSLKPIFQECFYQIFESEKVSDNFLFNVKRKYEKFVLEDLEDFDREDEFKDLLTSKCFKNLITTIKKVLMYIEFHDPPLKLKVDSFKERKMERKSFKNSECICVEGLVKENKKCLIILNPPVLKNGFAFHGLKPIVMVYNQELPPEMFIDISIEEDKHQNKNDEEIKEKVLNNNLINEVNKSTNLDINIVNAQLEHFLIHNKLNPNHNLNAKKKTNTSQKHFFHHKTKSTNEKVLNISDSLNFELKMDLVKEISPINQSPDQNRQKSPIIRKIVQEAEKNNESKENNYNYGNDIVNTCNKSRISNDQNTSHILTDNILNSNDISANKAMINYIELDNNDDKNILKGTNFMSTSHHNLSSVTDNFNNGSKLSSIGNKNMKGLSIGSNNILTNNNTSSNEAFICLNNKNSYNDRNLHSQNLNGIFLNANSSTMKDPAFDKLENLVQTSRSQFESNLGDFVNVDNYDNMNINDHDYEFDNIETDYNYRYEKDSSNKILTTSLSNSFTLNKKNDLINTIKNINIGNLNLDRDNISNTSDCNYNNKTTDKVHSKKISNLISNILINNSDKKSSKGNWYMYQSTERGLNVNTLTKTIEKLGVKGNPVFIKAGSNRNVLRSLSKTPKQNKPVIGYSPRNNIHYIFHDKQTLPNNIIIKVAKKNGNNPRYTNVNGVNAVIVQEDKRNSKHSSVSKEKKLYNLNYGTNKTVEDEIVHNAKNPNHNQNIYKYKEFVKGKVKSGNNSNCANSNNNFFMPNFKQTPSHNNLQVTQSGNINVQSTNTTANIVVTKTKNNTSYTKTNEEQPKKRIIQKDRDSNKDYINQSGSKKTNKSIDRRILTNAQTKLCVDELLSFKKNEKGRGSPLHRDKANFNAEAKNTKGNFLNIKYV